MIEILQILIGGIIGGFIGGIFTIGLIEFYEFIVRKRK